MVATPKRTTARAQRPTAAKTKAKTSKASSSSSTSRKPRGNAPVNETIAELLDELTQYEVRDGNKYAGMSDDNAAAVLRRYTGKLNKGSDVAQLPGIGPGTVAKIDEYLKTGHITKLDEFRRECGSLGKEAKTALKAAAAAGKKRAGVPRRPDEPEVQPLTEAQEREIKAAEERYDSYTPRELRALLKKNGARTAGSKREMVERCGEGSVLGGYPACPQCHGGQPHFNRRTGFFECPGFVDGPDVKTDWKACFFKGALKRPAWKE
jgi:hypothetical protein